MGGVRFKLSVMMFLQYFIWGCWAVPLGSYLGGALGFPGSQIGWIYSSTAIAAMIAPLFVGYVADRLFATERILGILHLVGGVLLAVAATQKEFVGLMTVMTLYSVCYMPTLALTNSLSFRNIGNPEQEFPLIRVFGTFGWIAAGLTVGVALGET
ncbi:MAG TPA: MFS transporter, partial [Pirellulales bacterium]